MMATAMITTMMSTASGGDDGDDDDHDGAENVKQQATDATHTHTHTRALELGDAQGPLSPARSIKRGSGTKPIIWPGDVLFGIVSSVGCSIFIGV